MRERGGRNAGWSRPRQRGGGWGRRLAGGANGRLTSPSLGLDLTFFLLHAISSMLTAHISDALCSGCSVRVAMSSSPSRMHRYVAPLVLHCWTKAIFAVGCSRSQLDPLHRSSHASTASCQELAGFGRAHPRSSLPQIKQAYMGRQAGSPAVKHTQLTLGRRARTPAGRGPNRGRPWRSRQTRNNTAQTTRTNARPLQQVEGSAHLLSVTGRLMVHKPSQPPALRNQLPDSAAAYPSTPITFSLHCGSPGMAAQLLFEERWMSRASEPRLAPARTVGGRLVGGDFT